MDMPDSVHNPNVNSSATSIAENMDAKHSDVKDIHSDSFYGCYYGHPIEQLTTLCEQLQLNGCTTRIFLVGDSSLDNKYWFGQGWADACNGYERILAPPRMKKGYTKSWFQYSSRARISARIGNGRACL